MRFCRYEMRLAPSRVMARKPLWVSVRRRPVIPRVSQTAARNRSRRRSGMPREPRRNRLPSAYGVVVDQGVDQPRDIGGTVLSVGIESHNIIGTLLQREVDACLERGALPQIHRVRDKGGAGGERNLARPVMRAVINDNHAIVSLHEVRNDGAEDRGLVKSRNDDPNRSRIELFTPF